MFNLFNVRLSYHHYYHYHRRDLRMLLIRQEQRWKLIRKPSVSHCPSFHFLSFVINLVVLFPCSYSYSPLFSSPLHSFLLLSSSFLSSLPLSPPLLSLLRLSSHLSLTHTSLNLDVSPLSFILPSFLVSHFYP